MSHRVERSALVQYSAQQMFDLVNDIEAYPEYMDDCVGAQVLQRGPGWLEARLELQKAGLTQSFVTRNELQPPTRMTMKLVEGPFSRLEGCWTFEAIDSGACRVGFELAFDMKSRLLGMAVGKLFESAASKQVDALCRRAQNVYGLPHAGER
ncbi:type II toxin-antitoxin system RatA family toxin [Marinimicrobium sp. ABcell2]|uniref:type II toxin-antitoxin system RatA family toxin n=1 Tax=Marinimicrobium sp. ABcell2 TaxID=3069751 RepID=UPI0027AFDB5F|nr:type II toxin-antitoxin system RatA family toxin [Marinimicrobium sp. ABcell2]MDQ2076359.1 type II toxin-antitoxin system RatA family toxin [Marinimicrobium sp. ABcell2]